MTTQHIIEYDVKEAKLKELAIKRDDILKQYKENKDIELVRKAKREVAKLRIAIEKRRKEYKADALEYGRMVDTKAKEASEPVVAIESSYDDIIDAYDAELARLAREAQEKEEARIAIIKKRIEKIMLFPDEAWSMNSKGIESLLQDLHQFIGEDFDYQEFSEEAQNVNEESKQRLITILENQKKTEEEKTKLDEQRKKDEAERAKFEAERAAFEKAQAEANAKLQAERDAIEAERRAEEEKRRQAEIERERKELEELRERDRLKRIEVEKEEAARIAQLEKEAVECKAKQENEDRVRNAAPDLLEALKSLLNIFNSKKEPFANLNRDETRAVHYAELILSNVNKGK